MRILLTDEEPWIIAMVNQENYIFSIQERNFISTKNVTKKNPKINKPTSAPAKNNRFAFQLSLKESYDGRSNFYRETNDNQYLYCFYGLVVLVVCIISCIPISLIPMHDLITDPEYWYELMIIFLPLGFLHSGHIAIAVKTLLNDLNKRLPALIVDLFCTTTLASAFLVSLLHILWSSVWGYLEPFPFRRLIVLLTTTITVLIRVYCVFSKERRSIQGFATRCRAFIFAILWMVVIGLQFAAIRMIGNRTSIEIQWLGVIVVWMVKEMNDFVVGKIIANAATSENIVGAQMWGKLLTNITFSFWIWIFKYLFWKYIQYETLSSLNGKSQFNYFYKKYLYQAERCIYQRINISAISIYINFDEYNLFVV